MKDKINMFVFIIKERRSYNRIKSIFILHKLTKADACHHPFVSKP